MCTAVSARRSRPRCGAPRSTSRAATPALPQEFFAHASRGEVLADVGLTDRNIARQITGWVAALGAGATEKEVSSQLD